MSTDFSVKVNNDGGYNPGVPNGEWICRQDKFCSYAPSSLSSWALSQFGDYNAFADWLPTDTNIYNPVQTETMVLLEDGSAKYSEPVCPASNCEAVLFYDDYMQNTLATCPIGTEMELRLTGLAGEWNRCVTPDSDVILSGDLPQGCNLVSGSYCCAAGSVSTLHFVHQTAPCQPGLDNGEPCIYPQTGSAYGLCGVNGECARNLQASDVIQELPPPTLTPTTLKPSGSPSLKPSKAPVTDSPTMSPSAHPSVSDRPTSHPSDAPTTREPSKSPSKGPSSSPVIAKLPITGAPTQSPMKTISALIANPTSAPSQQMKVPVPSSAAPAVAYPGTGVLPMAALISLALFKLKFD